MNWMVLRRVPLIFCLITTLLPDVLAQQSPQFTQAEYSRTFNQNLLSGNTIVTLSCSFAGVVNYQFQNPSAVSFLSLSETTGSVSLNIDALSISTMSITTPVNCFDANDNTNSDTALLTVERIDQNEFSPVFSHGSLDLSFREDLPVSSLVANINATDNDLGNFGVIGYSIVSSNPEVSRTFTIDSVTGEITLQSSLDYEENEMFLFLVQATNTFDTATARRITVTIGVVDLDDTPPAFENATYDIAVHETVIDSVVADRAYPRPSPGFLITRCIDPDTPSSQITYSITSGGDISPLVLDETSGSFSVTDDLDYETRISYSFMVTCYENSEQNFSSTVNVDVAILPVNEQVPQIVRRLRTVVVEETVDINSIIATANQSLTEVSSKFEFSDSDAGPDGNITYTLRDTSFNSGDSEAFSLDLLSGDLKFTVNFDIDVEGVDLVFGRFRRFAILIIGCDEHPPSIQCNNFDFSVFLVSINEFEPVIAEERYTRSFLESYEPGSVIISADEVACTDRDRGTGDLGLDHVEIVATSSRIEEVFHIDTRTGEILLQGEFDYEVDQSYGFSIRCYDNDGFEDLAVVSIDIIPENDNIPTFDQRSYLFNVSRTTPANRYVIGTVSATDRDVDLGGDITYSLESNSYVDINELGELLLFNSVLNITETTISFNVFVTDSEFTDDVLVVLQITEGNTNRPSFAGGTSLSLQLSELVMVGETIADLSCSDSDSGVNGEVRFSIASGNTDDSFHIDEITGEITVNRALTLPEGISTESYTLAISCEDRGVPTFSDDATIFVVVLMDDSNPPVIQNTTINLFLSENTLPDTVVATIVATDIDSDQLNYRLENQSNPGFFFIEPTSGNLTLGVPLDRELISEFHMVVVVTENRIAIGPERSDSANINIFIRDVNDNDPMCTRTLYNADVDETAGVGTLVVQLDCSDPDLNENGMLTYTLVDDFGVLSIDSSTGAITIGSLLNNTDSTVLPATVIVSDSGISEPREIQIQVTVSIISRNNNMPTFQNLPATINISEAQTLRDVFFTASATDLDRGSFGQVSYAIVGGDQNTFSIISNTGGISLTQKLNFFSQSVHSLNISASDPDFTVYETLTINVLDANEYDPVCSSLQESFLLAESIEPSALEFQRLTCSDDDEGSNGQITYTIESGNVGSIFEIETDGTVATVDVLDYETVQEYNMEVRVADRGIPSRFTSVDIRVTVIPINEFSPVFEQDAYEINVTEHSDVSTLVLQITASDEDLSSHQDGQILYSISGPDASFFSISSSGNVRIASAIDREVTGNSLMFTVTATDQAVIPRSSSALVNVTVIDLDDNSPAFTTDLYVFVVNASASVGSPVGNILCTDEDTISNAQVSYSFLEEGEHSSIFVIEDNGNIQFRQNIPINSIFTFDVVCTGPAPLNRSSSATVSVRVLLNSTISFYPDSTYIVNLEENSDQRTELVIVNATSSTGAALSFNQLNLLSQFDVDESTGSVQLIGALDFETTESYTLRVEASDNGDPPNTNEALVQINVINLNDRNPRITTEPTEIVREEDNNNDTQLLDQYLCTDGDRGNFGVVTFRIAEGDTNNLFRITESGMLLLEGNLDFEIATGYTLRVVCEDGGSPPLSDEITVPIRILPVNDNPPVFGDVSSITLPENTPTETSVGLPISATDLDSAPHNVISYTLSPTDTPFSISSETGQLTLISSLDFEDVTEYQLSVRADNNELSTTANVTITVIDVNDNIPRPTRFIYIATIPESAGIGDFVLTVVCNDADSGVNGEVTYAVIGDVPFEIDSTEGDITVSGMLDHESNFIRRFEVACSDPDTTITTDILVLVSDVDEHSPVFVSFAYNFSISEDDDVGIEVGTVEADDQDGNTAGILTYAISNSSLPFEINEDNGVITLALSVDFEEMQQYMFFVEASDVAGNTDYAEVSVEIINVNDNDPSFSDAPYSFSVRESSPQNTPAGTVICVDLDDEAEGVPVRYSLGMQNIPFQIDPESGVIFVNGEVDFETVPRHIFEVFCSDSGNVQVSAGVTIDLEPFNDFAPMFIRPSGSNDSELGVAENVGVGFTLTTLLAVDSDFGPLDHTAVVFSIVGGNDDGIFTIASDVFLRLQVSFDREQVSEYLLVLKAANVISSDDTSNSTSLFSIATYRIIVTDVNDNRPILTPENPPIITIVQSNSSNVVVFEFTCTDADEGLNGTTQFSLSSTNPFDNFNISDDGVVRTLGRVNASIVLDVTCSDRGDPSQSATVHLAINAVVVNEHAPIFSSPTYIFSVPENATLGSIVDCVQATDMDGADTLEGTVRYFITLESPLGQNSFAVEEDTGCVLVAAPLNFDLFRSYMYEVIATDLSPDQLSSTAQLIINIEDTNPAPPVFENTPYSSSLFENQEMGTFVTDLSCSDIDSNDVIRYSILEGNEDGIFSINTETGVITLSSDESLDYEISTAHVITAACTDRHNLQATTLVTVMVLPINEHTPTFASGPFQIEENAIFRTEVIQLQYDDFDAGLDGEVMFEVIGGILNDDFILTSSGQILVNGELDREEFDFYSFEVRITDQSVEILNRRTQSQLVNITILDQNDNEPVFDSEVYTYGPLSGNETNGLVVGNVSCSDSDIGNNAMITYSLSEASNLFDVDMSTGEIFVSGDLETRQFDDIILFIICRDGGATSLSDISRVLIEVQEVNRNAPEFLNSSYFVRVAENISILNDVIITVQAADLDEGVNGEVRYSLLDDIDTTFFINEDTGDITTLRSLDVETRAFYVLTIIARDGAVDSNSQMTAAVNVTIEVIGINEFTPICADPIYVTIINRTTIGPIINFECTDSDNGEDGMLAYSIQSGNDNGFFNTSNDGFLLVTNFIQPDPNFEQFILEIEVRDLGTPSLDITIEAILIYSFDNLDDPTFDSPFYTFNVSELSTVGSVFGLVQALDTDPGLQGQIVYSVVDTETFEVNPVNGELFVSRPLDWESVPAHTFTVSARDSDPFAPMSAEVTVLINVVNENDNVPQCDSSFYNVEILSNAALDDTILQLNCSDADQMPIEFAVVSGQASPFEVDPITGRVYVAGTVIPSTTSVLDVNVIGSGGEFSVITISIQALFINVQPPVFNARQFSVSVLESTPLLSVIGQLSASDLDSPQADLVYGIEDLSSSIELYVDPRTGEVILTTPFDFETRTQYSYTVFVTDSGSHDGANQLRDTATLVVNVTNANDNAPQFDNGGVYGTTISETTPLGTILLNMTCMDADAPPFSSPQISAVNLSVTPFQLVSRNDQYSIEVSEQLSGPSSFIFDVLCTDNGGRSTEGQVYIFVPEPLAPVFTQNRYDWVLSETSETGEQYRNVQASSNDGSAISYSITDGNDNSVFYIEPDTGVVILVRTLDFETQTSHGLVVRAVDGSGRQSSVLLLVTIVDENDEVPLTPPSALLSVQQDSSIGFPIGVLECTDSDSMMNTSFRFDPPSTLFSVDDFGVVRLEGILTDTPVYSLPVICYDLSRPEDVSMGIITIEVNFVNLYAPVFDFNSYIFTLAEDVGPLSFVGQVLATDSDVGSFGEVGYVITDGNPDQFFIDAISGNIGVLTSLDREMRDMYTLTIAAVDGGVAALPETRLNTSILVTIRITDINDNPPLPEQFTYVQSISTNHTLLSPVLLVICTDADLFDNGVIDYSLEQDGQDFIIQNNGTILLAREQHTQNVHNFQVVCTDRGVNRLSSTAQVTVTVDIVSLTAPVFDQQEYNATIDENIAIHTPVLQVSAMPSSPDIEVVYSIVAGNELGDFIVDPLSGIILVIDELDATVQQLYALTISATVTGRASVSSLVNVFIIVIDLNDNVPQFSSPFYAANITEGSSPTTPIVQLSCTDEDLNSRISYSILYALDLFNITDEGLIYLANDIDFENGPSHSFEVLCSDSGNSPNIVLTSVRINVDPVNEFIPRFVQSRFNFTASENSFGAQIGFIEAIDEDAGVHGNVRYFLQDPANNSIILINFFTGELIVANNLDYEVQNAWDLSVIAIDGGGLESFAIIHIDVQNLNDVIPVISPVATITTINSDSPAGQPIQSFTCTDEDGSATSLSIDNGNSLGLFELNSDNILIWTGRGQSLDANAVISLNLLCVDSALTTQRVSGHIAIGIQVTSAQPPVFSEAFYLRNISETAIVNTSVLTVSATSESMNTSYSFFNLPSGFPFKIDSESGEIILTSSLNREIESLYTFFVGATDIITSGVGVVLVEIRVEDSNDNEPIIFLSQEAISLREDISINTEFFRLMCTDRDSGLNGEVIFIITSEHNDTFSINRINSEIAALTITRGLDFELEMEYVLDIECSDNGSPSLSDIATLTVVVTGVNEFRPNFTETNYNFQVNETALPGSLVGIVMARDLDAGDDGLFEYQIEQTLQSAYFTINSIGEIRTTSLSLNSSITPQLGISVRAVDTGGNEDIAFVTVFVLDTNTPPILSDFGTYFVTLTTNQSFPTIILELFCYDIDATNNAALSLEFFNQPMGVAIDTISSQQGLITASFSLVSFLPAGTYDILLICSDNGTVPLSATSVATIQVQGENTPPVFDHGTVFISLLESSTEGLLVTTVNATDAEGNITYAISGGTGRGTFSIHAETGEVRLLLALNHELTSNYFLTVSAFDNSIVNQLSARVNINVDVVNVNDELPVIMPQGIEQIVISESQQLSVPIRTYSCTDPDGSVQVSFSLSPQNSPFVISQNGEIILESALNVDIQDNFVLEITCTDREIQVGSGVELSSTVTLIVVVVPVNSHAPEFQPPFELFVPEDTLRGSDIGQLLAVDMDMRGQVTYSSTSHTDLFLVESLTGNVVLVGAIDYESGDIQYSLSVDASDNDGAMARTSSAMITVFVTDVNDHSPICQTFITVQLVTGDYPLTSFAQLSCTDADSGNNSLLVYTIQDLTQNVGEIFVNESTGELFLRGDFNTPGAILFTVLVSDSGIPSFSTQTTVVLLLESNNTNAVHFSPSQFNVSLSENADIGTVILNGSLLQNALVNPTTDAVTFGLELSVDNGGAFLIEPTNGDITLIDNQNVDFESNTKRYTIVVNAIVNGATANSAIILVTLEDYNDNRPVFSQPVYTAEIRENQPAGISILQVSSTDIDSGMNSVIRYSTTSSDFAVDIISGEITSLLSFDRETNERYTIIIKAMDLGSPSQNSTALVTIVILDENDEPPVFRSAFYVIDIDNLTPPNQDLLTLEVIDRDANSSLRFELLNVDSELRALFTVDVLLGVVKRGVGEFPVDHSDRYNFTVRVNDGIFFDNTTIVVFVASVTTDTTVFIENTLNSNYNLKEFLLLQDFDVSMPLYEITEGDQLDEFSISSTGILTTNGELDRERIAEYILTIHVTDNSTQVNVNVYLTVIVKDVNDNTPTFSADPFTFSLPEGIFQDEYSIGTVTATDLDESGTNAAVIEYSIFGSIEGIEKDFSIHPRTGELFVRKGSTIDYEQFQNITLAVRARDNGEPSALFSSAFVVLQLTDVNDNDPEFVPVDVVEYIILVGKQDIPENMLLDNVVAILPKGIQLRLDRFEFTDPDVSSNVTASLIDTSANNYFKLEQNFTDNTATLLTREKISVNDINDAIVLQIVLSDEQNEQNPITKNVTISFTDVIPIPPSTGPVVPSIPFFETEIGIAVIVVICMFIIALFFLFLCMCCYCYVRIKREKDPLRNRDRMITVAQRLNTETDRKGKKVLGRPMNYFGYSDLDPLEFPEYSAHDPDSHLLYAPHTNGEFESSFMIQNEGFESDVAELEDPFGPSTDTSVLSSLPLDDGSDSNRGYTMGPVLRAMLEEWDNGDELLSKNKKKKKKAKDKKPARETEDSTFLY